MTRRRHVVVGAGTSGCVVAARLAEAGEEVIVLEAGPDLRPGQDPTVDGDDVAA